METMGSQLNDIEIRALTATDEPFLWEMLYQAIYVPKGQPLPPREIIYQRPLSCYVKNWRRREGDCGFLAVAGGQPVGAVWLRLSQGDCHGYGYVDDETPELSMALLPAFRSKGIGTQLFQRLFASPCIHPRVSLSVSAKNPARRLYERVGFEVVGQDGESLTMVRTDQEIG